jgi:hypothetical protein
MGSTDAIFGEALGLADVTDMVERYGISAVIFKMIINGS